MSTAYAPPSAPPTGRRTLVIVTVGAFAIAAIAGIAVLLMPDMGELGWKVTATTAVIGVTAFLLLCGSALLGRPGQLVGVGTISATLATSALVLLAFWMPPTPWVSELGRPIWSGVCLSVGFAAAALLIARTASDSPLVRTALRATLALITITSAMSLLAVWYEPPQEFWRVYGIVAILTALGLIATPVLRVMGRPKRPAPVGVPTALSPATIDALRTAAEDRGMDVDHLVANLLTKQPGPK